MGWWEGLRNWVSEAISSPQAAAFFLLPICSGTSLMHLPGLQQKPSEPGLSRTVGTPACCPGWFGCGQGGQAGPAGARPLGAAAEGRRQGWRPARVPTAAQATVLWPRHP